MGDKRKRQLGETQSTV
eukprot:ctg_1654.g287